jgi:hypothetical protein
MGRQQGIAGHCWPPLAIAENLEERLPIATPLEVGRFAPEIDSDGAVFAGLASGVAHGSPLYHQVSSAEEIQWR